MSSDSEQAGAAFSAESDQAPTTVRRPTILNGVISARRNRPSTDGNSGPSGGSKKMRTSAFRPGARRTTVFRFKRSTRIRCRTRRLNLFSLAGSGEFIAGSSVHLTPATGKQRMNQSYIPFQGRGFPLAAPSNAGYVNDWCRMWQFQ